MFIGFLTTKVYKNFVKFLIAISFEFAGSRDLLSAATIVGNSKNVRCIIVAYRSFLDLNFQKKKKQLYELLDLFVGWGNISFAN